MLPKQHILFLLALNWLLLGSLYGQRIEPKKQVLPAGELQWKFVQSKNFRIHYYTLDESLGELTLKLAEEALFDLAKQLDYRPRSQYALHLFLSPNDLVHSNQFTQPLFKEQGITTLTSNSSCVVYPGSTSALRDKVRAAVARSLFSGDIRERLLERVMTRTLSPDLSFSG